jgi:serine phosphatase RsbU (regulator of sigma subunit)
MQCNHCGAENPAQYCYCAECGQPLFLAMLKEISEPGGGAAGAIRSHHIFANGATIGRHHDNTVILHDPALSRFHARLDYQNGRFYIQDLSSSNGVFVNDAKVRRREIKDFDRLMLGETMLLFRVPPGGTIAISSSPKPFADSLLHTQEEFLAAVKGMSQHAKNAAFSNEVLEIAARFAIKITRAERAVIFLYDDHRKLQPAVFHNVTPSDVHHDQFEVSRSALAEAEATGEMVIREECLTDPRYKLNQSIQALQLNTIICLPLKTSHPIEALTLPEAKTGRLAGQDVMFGILYLDSRRVLKGLPQHRRTMLQVLADQAALTIANALLQKEMREKHQLNKQIGAAKAMQQRLFPPPSFSHAQFELAYHYAPAQQIGGDYLAFLPLSESRFLFAVGDVVGKGLPAGLVVMTVHGGLYSEISHHTDLLPLVHNLDRLIYEYAQGKVFVTFFAGVLDAGKMKLEYTSAGHQPPLLYRRASSGGAGWRELSTAGMPLGLNPDIKRAAKTITLQSGDLLTLYTDGITEARNSAKKQFGKAGLKKMLSGWLALPDKGKPPLTELVNTVFGRVQHFTNYKPLEDDTTLLAVVVK